MDLAMAKQLLSMCVKYELRDHAFGDCEVGWADGERQIANGYFGSGDQSVTVTDYSANEDGSVFYFFKGKDAEELRSCFAFDRVERNDSTGPDEFEVGKVMPGLTKEGVRKELTGE